MTDFLGVCYCYKELFKSKKTINYPFEKGKITRDTEVKYFKTQRMVEKKMHSM